MTHVSFNLSSLPDFFGISTIAEFSWIQKWDSQIQEIRPEDVVWILPGQKYWHGAIATTAMANLVIKNSSAASLWTSWNKLAANNTKTEK